MRARRILIHISTLENLGKVCKIEGLEVNFYNVL